MFSIFRSCLQVVALVAACVVSAATVSGCSPLRLLFPSNSHETVAPELPADFGRPAILLFTKTNGYRHDQAIDAGVPMFEEIAKRRGWSLFHTENSAVHRPELLGRFDAVVWHNTSGNVLSDDQRASLMQWIEGGGGFVGVHGAGGDPSYDWTWYVEELIGAQFIGHTMGPQFQDATLVVEDRSHPATRRLPASIVHNEEWYSFDRSVRDRPGWRVLASVDESTYTPRMDLLWMDSDLSMGDHPVVWSHCLGRGRTFFSALGHQRASYARPEMRELLEGATAWAAFLEGTGCR